MDAGGDLSQEATVAIHPPRRPPVEVEGAHPRHASHEAGQRAQVDRRRPLPQTGEAFQHDILRDVACILGSDDPSGGSPRDGGDLEKEAGLGGRVEGAGDLHEKLQLRSGAESALVAASTYVFAEDHGMVRNPC
jgi:hypothetical protein